MSNPDARAALGRKPTLDEAVAWVLQSATREYRKACIRHWKTLYGDEFANQVEERVKHEWNRKQQRR